MTEKKTTGAKKTTKKATKKPAAKKATAKKATASKKTAKAASNNTSELKDRAIEKARSVATDGKARTEDVIDSLSKMIENSAQTIDENVGAKYGDYARSAADAVSSFGDKLNEKEVDDIVDDARDFVKKSPAVAIGAAAAIGFVLARMIKSGSDKDA